MTVYVLDTNIASAIIRGRTPQLQDRLMATPDDAVLAISVITQTELLFGLAKRGHPSGLSKAVHAFLERVTILPWTASIAPIYADLHAHCEGAGITLGAMDMLIAAHAKAAEAVLVSADGIFQKIPIGFALENWL